MQIRLPQMPFKFITPDGLMEVTVRNGTLKGKTSTEHYAAAAAFIDHGPKALERIQITPNAKTHSEVMKTLLTGFKINLKAHAKESLDYRVLEALSTAQGVIDLDN
ncbi:MAG: hypothetical protein NTX39_03450 [Opitutae bacterium]|jgi:hypothetical protein|nr:hypothetical protein [Opitutae bacterium]